MSDFMDRLKRLTGKNRGWKRYISGLTGISPTTISAWENSNPSFEWLQRIGDRTGYSLDYLITGRLQKADIPKRLLTICEVLETLDDDELADVQQYAEYVLSKRPSHRTNGRAEGTA